MSNLESSSIDEKPPHLINEKKEVPPSRTRYEQINDISEDRASVSSTDMLVSNVFWVFFIAIPSIESVYSCIYYKCMF